MYFVTTGYLASSVFLRDSHELGVLVVNTIRRVSLFIYLYCKYYLLCYSILALVLSLDMIIVILGVFNVRLQGRKIGFLCKSYH